MKNTFYKIFLFLLKTFVFGLEKDDEINHDFWLKVQKEWGERKNEESVFPFLCYRSNTFKNIWPYFYKKIIRYARLFTLVNFYKNVKVNCHGKLFFSSKYNLTNEEDWHYEIRTKFIEFMLTETKTWKH